MKDLAELKRLLTAATPGPWRAEAQDPNTNEGFSHCIITQPDGRGDDYAFVDVSNETDAALIIAAVNAFPDLIAEIENFGGALKTAGNIIIALEKRIKRLEAALREIEAIEFGRGLEVAKQIARTALESEK